jgi:hypothetical protein
VLVVTDDQEAAFREDGAGATWIRATCGGLQRAAAS